MGPSNRYDRVESFQSAPVYEKNIDGREKHGDDIGLSQVSPVSVTHRPDDETLMNRCAESLAWEVMKIG